MRLGEILVRGGVITPEQLEAALTAQGIYGGRLGTNLVEQGFINLDTLTLGLSKRLGVPPVLEQQLADIPPEVIKRIPAVQAEKHQAIPVRLELKPTRKLYVAFLDPHTIAGIDELGFVAGARIAPLVAPELRILYLLEKHYGISRKNRFLRIHPMGREVTGIMPDNPNLDEVPVEAIQEDRRPGEERRRYVEKKPSLEAEPQEPDPRNMKTVKLKQGFSMPEVDTGVSLFVGMKGADVATAAAGAAQGVPSASELQVAFTRALSRDDIGDAIIEYTKAAFGCGLVLVCKESLALGWKGFVPGADAALIESLAIPVQSPGALGVAHETRAPYYGAPPPAGAALQSRMCKLLKLPVPEELAVVPICLKERVVSLVYVQSLDGSALPPARVVDLQAICQAAGTGFLNLIKRAKQK